MMLKENMAQTLQELRRPLPERIRVIIEVKSKRVNEIRLAESTALKHISSYITDIGGEVTYISRLTPYIAAEIPTDYLDVLRKQKGIVNIKIEPIMRTMDIPSVPLAEATNIPLEEVIKEVKADQLWDKVTGKDIRVAIVDTGIEKEHPMFMEEGKTKVIAEKSFVEDEGPEDLFGHGTFTAGCVAGYEWETDIGTLMGAAPGALLINAKPIGENGTAPISDIMKAIEWVVTPESEGGAGGADIFSCSWGGTYPNVELYELIRNIKKRHGSLWVFSIGNSGPSDEVGFPGGYREVVSVGSVALQTPNYKDATTFSSRGPGYHLATKPDFLSPGGNMYMKYDFEGEMGGDEQIYGPVPESVEPNRYIPWRGTSFSCPVVSGIMACLMEKHPDTSVIPAPHAKKDNNKGFGTIDAIGVYNLLPIGQVKKEKTVTTLDYDPVLVKKGEEGEWDDVGVSSPTPYRIGDALYLYYKDAWIQPEGVGLAIYNEEEDKFEKKGKVIDSMTPPGIVTDIPKKANKGYENVHYGFYCVMRGETPTLCVSESDDGITWRNERTILTLESIPFSRVGAVHRIVDDENKIYLYWDGPSKLTAIGYAILYYDSDTGDFTVDEQGTAITIGYREGNTGTTYRLCGAFGPYCMYDGTKFQMFVSAPPRFIPWHMARAESTDGTSFNLKEIISWNRRDYNHLFGLCLAAPLQKKIYHSYGSSVEVFYDIVHPEIYSS